jgi:hypothetical protein
MNLGRALVEVKPGPSCCVTHPFSRPGFALATGVPARAELPACRVPSRGRVAGGRLGDVDPHSGQSGRDQQDGSADYKLHARTEWNEQALFEALLPSALAHCPGRFVPIALDDTRLRKTGQRIPMAFWQRDPLSPPFHVNLQWGLRFLQASLLLPLHRKDNVNARAVPVRLIAAPSRKKPGAKADL